MSAQYAKMLWSFMASNRNRKIKIEDILNGWPELKSSLIKQNGVTLPNGIMGKKSSKPNSFGIPQTVTVPTPSRAMTENVSNVLACNNHGCAICDLKPKRGLLQSIAIRTGGKTKGALLGSGDRIMCDYDDPTDSGEIAAQYKK